MQGATSSTAVPAMEEEESWYVKVASRFYRRGGGGDTMARPHYLDSCFLCKRSIACDRDIFMYRGDAAFCSDDCRQEQMDMDEALHAVARRHRQILRTPSSSSAATGDARPTMMRRRPTIANLAARNPPVVAS